MLLHENTIEFSNNIENIINKKSSKLNILNVKCDGQGPGDKRISTQTKILYLRKEERERQ